MKKADLVALVAKKAGVTKKVAQSAVDAVIKGISDALTKGQKVTLVGFGTFEVRKKAARKARNPRNRDQIIEVPEKMVPKFRPSSKLKEAVAKLKVR